MKNNEEKTVQTMVNGNTQIEKCVAPCSRGVVVMDEHTEIKY